MRTFMLSALELRKYRRGDLARAAIVALILLPLLYGTVYLIAFWNPYNNLSNVPAAIVNQDQPATANGQTVNAGQQLTTNLKQSQSLSWTQTDAASARAGLENGDYYYVITIPQNFSSSIASLGGTSPSIGVLTLQTNDANSYLTSLVGGEFATQITATLNQTVGQQFVATTLDGIIQIRQNLKQASNGAHQLAGGTSELKSGSKQLASGASQVAAGNTKLANAADVARSDAKKARSISADVVTKMRALVKQFPDSELAKLLLEGSIKVNSVVSDVTGDVITASEQIDELGAGAREVAAGAKALASGAVTLNSGANQLAQGLQQGVGQLPTWNNEQATNIANHASSPVAVRQIQLNNTGTYGAGFAPYFMGMSLWVALLVVYTLLKPLPARVLLAPRISALSVALTGYLPVLLITAAQVVVLLSVIHLGLGISPHPQDYALLFGFLLIVAGCYTAIIQLFGAVLGPAGRLVCLVLLMLQLCSCGGTYPIQMSPAFFQTISPYLPMTYAVSGVRHLLVNGALAPVARSALILLFIGAIALALTTTWVFVRRRVSISDLKPEIEM